MEMAAKLENWDFQDDALNGTEGLINRQKSAGNMIVLALDTRNRTARFLDRERKIQSETSLQFCDCRDFSFVGKSPRKTFQPCKHIYRLAMELGLLETHYLDYEAREALRHSSLGQLKRIEDARLQSFGRNDDAWGRWPAEIHQAGVQRNRQYRAYFITDGAASATWREGTEGQSHEYVTELDSCSCPDFEERRLPCKHIYALAIRQQLLVPFSREEYLEARRRGLHVVFEFPSERADPLSRF
jgi:predicted nucleic acid-binding Zn finger protein